MEPSRERPRVLLVGPGPPAAGGIATVIEAIAASRVAERFAITRFVTSARHAPLYSLPGRMLSAGLARGLGFDGAFDLEARAQLADFERSLATRPALVHLHCAHGWDFWLALRMARAARRAGIPALLQVHGNFDVVAPQWSALRRALFPRLLRIPQCLVVLSRSWKDWFSAHLDPARIEVIPNGVDTARFAPRDPAPPRAALRLLFVGTRDPEIKGALDLLAALPEIVRSAPDVEIVMAGEDPAGLEASVARDPASARRVTFLGRQEAAAMPALYAAADVLLLPSRREASPMALLEGMASGLPVVATRVGAIPEVLGSEGGILIAPGDSAGLARAVVALAGDAALRARFGRANRERSVRDFDAARFAERLGALYDRSIAAA